MDIQTVPLKQNFSAYLPDTSSVRSHSIVKSQGLVYTGPNPDSGAC